MSVTAGRQAAVVGFVAMLLGAAVARAQSGDDCSSVAGDVVIAARTPQVDLYDNAAGKRVMTLDADKFPACTPIAARAPNMMLAITMNGARYWVPPHMVRYRFAGALPPVCRNLALGSSQAEVGATRGLGENCPKPAGGR